MKGRVALIVAGVAMIVVMFGWLTEAISIDAITVAGVVAGAGLAYWWVNR